MSGEALIDVEKEDITPQTRLSDVLFPPDQQTFHSFQVLPSNVNAAEICLLFSNQREFFAVIVGPSGSGKSHLLQATATHMHLLTGVKPILTNTHDWVNSNFSRMQSAPLILDDVQEIFGKPRQRIQFRLQLERRLRAGLPTLLAISAEKSFRTLSTHLPNHRVWEVASITAPAHQERELLLRQIAKNEGVQLSDALFRILGHRLDVNGRTLVGAIKRLKLNNACWLSDHATLKACGLLNPFFADNTHWDLREQVVEATKTLPIGAELCRDLSSYLMIDTAQLSEHEVSHFLDAEPAYVYACSNRFKQQMSRDPEKSRIADAACRAVVTSLTP